MKEKLNEEWVKNISIEAAMFASWLEEKHYIFLHPDKLKNIIKKLLVRNNIEHKNSVLAFIGAGVITMLDNEDIKILRKQRFDFHAEAFMKSINVTLSSLKGSIKKQKKKTKPKPKVKSKKSDLKKDLKWFDAKGSFEKVKRGELIGYEDRYKPRAQYKSTKKFPLTGCWIFVEKHRENNKWKAYLRKLKKKYWEDVEYSRYCKDEDSAWASLYKKIMK